MAATLSASHIVQPLFPMLLILSAWPGLAASRRALAFTVGTVLVGACVLIDTPIVLLGSAYGLLYPADDMAIGHRAWVEGMSAALNTGGRLAAGIAAGVIAVVISNHCQTPRRITHAKHSIA